MDNPYKERAKSAEIALRWAYEFVERATMYDEIAKRLLEHAEYPTVGSQYTRIVPTRLLLDAAAHIEDLEKRTSAVSHTERKIPGMKRELVEDMPVLNASDMDVRGALFGLRFVKGCSNGCAELYIEDDENWHFKLRFDREWLADLAEIATPRSTPAPHQISDDLRDAMLGNRPAVQSSTAAPEHGVTLTPELLDKIERYGMHGVSFGMRTPVTLALVEAARRSATAPQQLWDRFMDHLAKVEPIGSKETPHVHHGNFLGSADKYRKIFIAALDVRGKG